MSHTSQRPEVVERFLRYVQVDTQADETSTTYPSSEKQKDLQRILVRELLEIGLKDAVMDEWGIVFATLPGNRQTRSDGRKTPVVGLIAHVDTSPDMSGTNVKPVLHENYDGGVLRLGGEWTLSPETYPPLRDHRGHTLITSDGTTLLGADDKAGVAEIMTVLRWLVDNPAVPRPTIRVAFTCDEEVGRGTEHFDVARFGADFAYTMDGGGVPGEIEDETFSADAAKVVFAGRNVHPGYAKNKMVNAFKVAATFVDSLPREKAPETTDGKTGFVHPTGVSGEVDSVTVKLILRSFTEDGLAEHGAMVRRLADEAAKRWPGATATVEISESYRNMKVVLDKHPEVVSMALEATRRAGMDPKMAAIRGGTDGSRLSFMGLPTPNIFTGGHLFHSRFEWISVETMKKAVETLRHLVVLWAE